MLNERVLKVKEIVFVLPLLYIYLDSNKVVKKLEDVKLNFFSKSNTF